MTGTYQEKKGRPNYYIVLDYGKDDTGKRQLKWISTDIPVKGNNIKRIKEKLKEAVQEYEVKKIDVGKDAYFADFIKNWLETIKNTKNIAITTYDAYLMTLNNHIIPFFEPLRLKVKEIEPYHIQSYVNLKSETGLSPNTIKKHIANISACLESAVQQNIIAFNPAYRIIRIKKVKYTGAKFLNEHEIVRLMESSKGDPLEIVILLTLFYGLRRSEVLGLKWRALNFEKSEMAINHTVVKVSNTTRFKDSAKNESSNAILPLPDFIKFYLEKWESRQIQNKLLQPNDYIDSDYICTTMSGDLIKTDYVSKHFRLLLKRNGLPQIRFHDLRHSSASYLKYLGCDMKDIQTWLRHGDIQTSMNLYTLLDMGAKTEIANNLSDRFMAFAKC